jgi:hypothetical protein
MIRSLLLVAAGCGGLASATPAAPAADAIAINVVVEPDDAFAGSARALNARLREVAPGGFVLDATHVPHVTVLQSFVRRSDLDPAIAAIRDAVNRSRIVGRDLAVTGLSEAPFAGTGMVSIGVERPPELVDLQSDLARVLAPFSVPGTARAFVAEEGGKPVNEATVAYVAHFTAESTGERYKPHVTVGVAPPAVAAKFVAVPYDAPRLHVKAVGLYQLGNFGTARLRLWSSAESAAGTDLYHPATSPSMP